MKIVICIDEDLGYSFNKRRQSRDKKMREHLLGVLRGEGAGLFVNAYSAKSLQSDGLLTDEEREIQDQELRHTGRQIDGVCRDKEEV